MGAKTYAPHGTPDYTSKTAVGCEADGEPVFLLRAQDVHAAEVVDYWAELVEEAGNDAMAEEARDIASRMRDWPQRKEPD